MCKTSEKRYSSPGGYTWAVISSTKAATFSTQVFIRKPTYRFCSSSTVNAKSWGYQNHEKAPCSFLTHPPSFSPSLRAPIPTSLLPSPNLNVVHQPSSIPSPPVNIQAVEADWALRFLPGHGWNRSGLRATNTPPIEPLQTRPAPRNCHLNVKRFEASRQIFCTHFFKKVFGECSSFWSVNSFTYSKSAPNRLAMWAFLLFVYNSLIDRLCR